MENKISFEEALQRLQNNVDQINLANGSLEDAIKAYNEGLKYYDICNSILDENEQKIVKVEKQFWRMKWKSHMIITKI